MNDEILLLNSKRLKIWPINTVCLGVKVKWCRHGILTRVKWFAMKQEVMCNCSTCCNGPKTLGLTKDQDQIHMPMSTLGYSATR